MSQNAVPIKSGFNYASRVFRKTKIFPDLQFKRYYGGVVNLFQYKPDNLVSKSEMRCPFGSSKPFLPLTKNSSSNNEYQRNVRQSELVRKIQQPGKRCFR